MQRTLPPELPHNQPGCELTEDWPSTSVAMWVVLIFGKPSKILHFHKFVYFEILILAKIS